VCTISRWVTSPGFCVQRIHRFALFRSDRSLRHRGSKSDFARKALEPQSRFPGSYRAFVLAHFAEIFGREIQAATLADLLEILLKAELSASAAAPVGTANFGCAGANRHVNRPPTAGASMKKELTRQQYLDLYYFMRLNRGVEDTMVKLFRQNKIVGGLYSSLGQEGISVGSAYASREKRLARAHDPQHRRSARQGRAAARRLHAAHGQVRFAHQGQRRQPAISATSTICTSSRPFPCSAT